MFFLFIGRWKQRKRCLAGRYVAGDWSKQSFCYVNDENHGIILRWINMITFVSTSACFPCFPSLQLVIWSYFCIRGWSSCTCTMLIKINHQFFFLITTTFFIFVMDLRYQVFKISEFPTTLLGVYWFQIIMS